MKENKEEIEVELFSTLDEYEINQICMILTENGIPFFKRNDGSGSYMNLYMGQSIETKRIYVSRDDYDKSLELIAPFLLKEKDNQDLVKPDENEEDEENNQNRKLLLIRGGLVFLILGAPILIIILAIVMSLIND